MFSRQRKRNLAILDPMQPEHIATHTAPLSAFFSLHWRTIFNKIKVLRRSVFSSAILNTLRLQHFPLADIPDSMNSELSATYESTVAFLPHLIELNSTRQKCDVWTRPNKCDSFTVHVNVCNLIHTRKDMQHDNLVFSKAHGRRAWFFHCWR